MAQHYRTARALIFAAALAVFDGAAWADVLTGSDPKPLIPQAAPTGTDPSPFSALTNKADTANDARVYVTPSHIRKDDLLQAYSADKAAREAAKGAPTPGLLDIATQTYRTQKRAAGGSKASYSLADAMREAVWRKNTAAKLKDLFQSNGRPTLVP